ncbi:FAD-dependent oxidoreductase [Leifsonia sp. C5G2]|uniref:GMC family oxidoreductase n=1 Tax=Leifsonia sp. C5G2 TaxID=2735269 RepID=UPI0015859D11|nr:FAD-dependent oxidoreductase [Leifsonia sp. C5G2]NUU07615.1 FAD-dependent oxidoreductase [Leifsonia sp. C5G2]
MDVIVIGAGSAGSVVARRLADAGHGVTVLEAGGEDANPAIHDPSRMGELWHSADDWDYRTVPQEHAAGRRLHLPRGKVLGGSHALNAMIWVRCAPEDYDGWAAGGNDGWAWDDVRGIFEEAEQLLEVTDDYALDPIQESIVQAAVEEGLERNPDYNSGHLDGVSQQQVTLRDGKRWNTYMAYLKPVRDRVDVRTGCWVHRLLIEPAQDGLRVVGVEFEQGGELQRLRADEVVLSAGALDSPRILLRSGIGPADELRAVGIEPVHDLPGVGRNLHDHLLSPVIFTTEKPVGPPRKGVSVTQSHLFWRSRPELPVPDTQPIHFSVPMYQEDLTGPADGFSLMAGLVTPKARGRLTLTGPGPHDPVAIDLDALGHPDDVASLAASVRQCRSIGRRPALAAWGARELHPGPAVSDDDLEDYVRRTAITYHHQVGTCAMGVSGDAVVTPRLRVHGVAGITVADASVVPTITTGNTNAPAVLIGEQAARFLLAP